MLHIDLGTQPRLLISGTTIRVLLLKAKDNFSLLAKTGDFRLQIENISLFIRKCDVSSSIVIAHEKALEQALVQMPFTRIETKTFNLGSGLKSVIIPNAMNVLEGASRKRKHDISENETNSVRHKKSKKQRSKSESETDVDSIVDDEFERNSVLSFKHQRIEKEKI
ncbi:uncharacterized protein F54H12.2 [Nephila pilipes]|uniref:Uncharacterized protein F54H12.2 n=1 Tax=Nephila pilipes TaxID=299642 RepID=A0A8X6NAS8_NEPPI|nr:uncharacterized protein F54H12.2 [Nephila pilipes]